MIVLYIYLFLTHVLLPGIFCYKVYYSDMIPYKNPNKKETNREAFIVMLIALIAGFIVTPLIAFLFYALKQRFK